MLARLAAARNQLTISPVRLTLSPSLTRRSEPKSTTPTWPASRFMHMPLTPEANLQRVSSTQGSKQDRVRHTRQAPQPGRSPSRGHARYHHYNDLVSIATPNGHSKFRPAIPQARHRGIHVCDVGSPCCCVVVCRQDPKTPLRCVLKNVPDGEDAASLGKAGLLLDTADPLLENGRDLGRRGLRIGECAGLEGRDDGCGISLSGTS